MSQHTPAPAPNEGQAAFEPDTVAGMPSDLMESAERASAFLKTVANSNRLMILCCLIGVERSVSELEAMLGMRQPALSQQLARLRQDDLVRTRRAGKMIFYSLNGSEAVELIGLLHRLFCEPTDKPGPHSGH
ncbi:MAG: metalloregulator ArsR/SmtB family transcription factor [Geminicoccaceae bacterium]